MSRLLTNAYKLGINLLGIHIPTKDTPPPASVQKELISKAEAKRQRRLMRNRSQ